MVNVKFGNTISKSLRTHTGVPQGVVLSTTCFLDAVNTILDTLAHNIEKVSYYHSSKESQHHQEIYRTQLRNWTDTVDLKSPVTRSEIVHFWQDIKGNPKRNHTILKLYNENIPKTKSKFLDMTLDRKLNWKPILSLKGEALTFSGNKSNPQKYRSNQYFGSYLSQFIVRKCLYSFF